MQLDLDTNLKIVRHFQEVKAAFLRSYRLGIDLIRVSSKYFYPICNENLQRVMYDVDTLTPTGNRQSLHYIFIQAYNCFLLVCHSAFNFPLLTLHSRLSRIISQQWGSFSILTDNSSSSKGESSCFRESHHNTSYEQ